MQYTIAEVHDARQSIINSLGGWAEDYDLDALVPALRELEHAALLSLSLEVESQGDRLVVRADCQDEHEALARADEARDALNSLWSSQAWVDTLAAHDVSVAP